MAPQPEQQARRNIDRLLEAAGWHVCDASAANIHAARGVAIRELPLPGYGFVDYLLNVDGKAAGVIEAKKEHVTLTDVETQSDKYTKGLPAGLPRWSNPLPFAYQTTGIETRFTNGLDPTPRSHPVFAFHQPKLLSDWLNYAPAAQPRAAGQVGCIDDLLFDEELVLLGEDGAPFFDSAKQKAYVIRGKSWVNNHAHVLRAKNGIPNAYTKHYLDIVDYHGFVTGTTRHKLNQAAMRQIPIPIAPPEQQKRIVAEIKKQFSCLTSGSRDWSQYYGRGTGVFVLAQNVRPFNPDFSVQKFVDPPSSDLSCDRSRIQDGDLLATIVGANAGQICLVAKAPSDAYVCQSVALIRPVLLGTGNHLNYWLNSAENGQRYLDQCMYGQGGPHLNFEQLMAAPIALPLLPEQHRIVAEVDRRFSLHSGVEAQVDVNLPRTERLRQSILATAFTPPVKEFAKPTLYANREQRAES